jgi:hypothetical protein
MGNLEARTPCVSAFDLLKKVLKVAIYIASTYSSAPESQKKFEWSQL